MTKSYTITTAINLEEEVVRLLRLICRKKGIGHAELSDDFFLGMLAHNAPHNTQQDILLRIDEVSQLVPESPLETPLSREQVDKANELEYEWLTADPATQQELLTRIGAWYMARNRHWVVTLFHPLHREVTS